MCVGGAKVGEHDAGSGVPDAVLDQRQQSVGSAGALGGIRCGEGELDEHGRRGSLFGVVGRAGEHRHQLCHLVVLDQSSCSLLGIDRQGLSYAVSCGDFLGERAADDQLPLRPVRSSSATMLGTPRSSSAVRITTTLNALRIRTGSAAARSAIVEIPIATRRRSRREAIPQTRTRAGTTSAGVASVAVSLATRRPR